MKKFILYILTGFAILTNLKAQSFYSIPVDSVYWVEYTNGPHNTSSYCWQHVRRLVYPTSNTMVYGSNIYTEYRCTEEYSFFNVIPNQCPSEYVLSDIPYAYLASDTVNKTILRLDVSMTTPEIIIYDFSKGLGDTLFIDECSQDTFVIFIEDSIDIGGEYRRRLGTSAAGIFANDTVYFIEGIGSNFGLAYNAYCPFEYVTELICYHYKDLEYGNTSSEYCTNTLTVENNMYPMQNIFQRIGNNTYRVKITEGEVQLNIYDLHGKSLHTGTYHQDSNLDLSLYPSGVYIATANANGLGYRPFKFVISH